MRSFSFEENSNPLITRQEVSLLLGIRRRIPSTWFFQASIDLSNDPSENRPVSCPEVSSTFESETADFQSQEKVVQTSDNTGTVEQSFLKIELVTLNDVISKPEETKRSTQSSSVQTMDITDDEPETIMNDGANPKISPTQEISTTEWMEKLRKEEQELMAVAQRESVSSTRKGRRKPPAPSAPSPVLSNGVVPSDMRNGQVVSHNRQLSAESASSGRILVQRSATTEMYVSQQHTRTLVPGEPSFSRHPMTLIDLKKQRVEDRKTASPIPRSPIPNDSNIPATTPVTPIVSGDSSEATRARFRAPSDAVVGRSSPRSRSPKLGMRCCSIT